MVDHHPDKKTFEVDEAVLQDFRKFLTSQNISFTEADLNANSAWVHSRIKREIFIDAFGQDEGLKISAKADPEVVKALELLPQAKQLADSAHRTVAQRNNTRTFNSPD